MCSLCFENNLLTIEGVRFASISKKTPISKLSFAFVSLALPLLTILWELRIMSEIWLYDYNYGVSLPLSEHVDIFPVRLVSTFH